MRLRLVLLVGVLGALVLASTVTAAPTSSAAGCVRWKATVPEADAANVVVYNSANPTGGQLTGTALPSKGSFFKVSGGSVHVDYGSVQFTVAPGTVFTLTCSGQTKGGRLWPTLQLAAGKIDVSDPAGIPGAVITYEGLFGVVPGYNGALTFSVRRKTAKPLKSVPAIIRTLTNDVKAPRGTTTVAAGSGSLVNVTPYVGSEPGHCRHCHAAELSSFGAHVQVGKPMSGGSAHYAGQR